MTCSTSTSLPDRSTERADIPRKGGSLGFLARVTPLGQPPTLRAHNLLDLPTSRGRSAFALEFGASLVATVARGAAESLPDTEFSARATPGFPGLVQVSWPVFADVGREITVGLSGGHARVYTPLVTGCTVRVLLDSSAVLAGPSFNRRGPDGSQSTISIGPSSLRPNVVQGLIRCGWAEREGGDDNAHLYSVGVNLGPGASASISVPPHARELELCTDRDPPPGPVVAEWLSHNGSVCPISGAPELRRVFVPTCADFLRITNPAPGGTTNHYTATFSVVS